MGLSTAKISAKVQFGKMPFNLQEKILPEAWTNNSVQTHCLNKWILQSIGWWWYIKIY